MKGGITESETVMHSMRLADNTKMDGNQVERVHTEEVEPNCRYDSEGRQQNEYFDNKMNIFIILPGRSSAELTKTR